MKKHLSYDEPPNKPFFRSSRKSSSTPAAGVSPGKRIDMRGQCVDQLLKSHQLFEKGVISKEQYEEFQASILNEVDRFWISFGFHINFNHWTKIVIVITCKISDLYN